MPPGDSVPPAELHPGVLPCCTHMGRTTSFGHGQREQMGEHRGAGGTHTELYWKPVSQPQCGIGSSSVARSRCWSSSDAPCPSRFNIVTQEPFTFTGESELPPLLSYTYPSGFCQQKRPDVINNPQLLSRQTVVGLPQPPPQLHPRGGCVSHHPHLGYFTPHGRL